ncbi:MAG: YfhO family protein [Gemmiger sp.]|nr:YfhO family protein [Gemmiger sp.]
MALPQLTKQKSRYWQVFFLCLAVSAALFLPHCIIDGLSGEFFHYAGDFNDQQIPFYAYANRFVKAGGSFSWATDLGSGFDNAYSFYLAGSPFFWLSLLFPDWLMPWLMVPFLCLKFALAGGGAYLWLRRWPKNESMAVLGACLYAFSGFAVYNIFFNHFLDVVALFPYLLASLDDAVLDGKRGIFPLWVAINLLNNYFFFAGQAVFLVIYFICMCSGKIYRLNWRLFGRLAFETLLGCALGCLLLVPAGLSLLQNPRTIDPFSGYGYLVYGKAQQYLAILYSMFLMPDAPYLTDMFSEGITKWTSLSAFLPLFGIAGGLAFARLKPRHPFTRILRVCVVCAFVPVLNSAFYALNSSYYARWYYMPLLVLAAASVVAIENRRADFKAGIFTVALFTLSAAAFALVPAKNSEEETVLGVVDSQPRFWALFGVSVLGILLFGLILHFFRNPKYPQRRQKLATALLVGVLGFSFVYGTVHLSMTKYGQWNHDAAYVQQTYREAEDLKAALPDDAFYRIEAYECYNNMGLWLDKSCIQFFNSTVAPHILEFYPTVGVKRDVNSKPAVSLYALRGVLGVRYTLVPVAQQAAWNKEGAEGWALAATSGSYLIYENKNWVPLGLTYQYYLTEEQFKAVPESERGNLLMKALVLSEEQIGTYGTMLEPLPKEEREGASYAAYTADCAARRATGATSFVADNSGFTATTNLESENLVFFSVPYDDGFAATVNGQPATIEKVDNGLMAVLAPAGESEIVFTYHTPGLALAGRVVLGAAAVYVLYVFWLLRRKNAAESAKKKARILMENEENK